MILCGVIGNFHDKEIECFHRNSVDHVFMQLISKMVSPNKLTIPAAILQIPEPEVCVSNIDLID
jgi:hypothetical protein